MAGDKTNSPDGNIGMQCVETKQTKQDKQNSVNFGGQATKSTGRMPWHWQAKKDVISCDKPRGAANSVNPRISEWRNPAG